ncbi:hypothetical protein [Halomontanus rarus]|uniref:hypothetical protein n=1 Tax=Halomontanus rarus TaxID=3034020 RepID=UPI0023E79B78|nr:hypothetical protein [Halovivax sp. TS33]
MYIDVHNHFLPESYVDLLLEWDTPVGLERADDQLYMVHERSGTASVKAGNRILLNEGFTEIRGESPRLQSWDESDQTRYNPSSIADRGLIEA